MRQINLEKTANWCAVNCPPMAWNTVILKTMDEIKKRHNYWLINLVKPKADMTIDTHCFAMISQELKRLYGVTLTEEMLK